MSGRMLAYIIGIIEIGFAIIFLPQLMDMLHSSIATLEQMSIIVVLSSFVFGVNQYSMIFFMGTIGIIVIFGIFSKDYAQFLSSFVKIHAFLLIMFWILFTKYAPDLQETLEKPLWILIIFHLGILFLVAKAIELIKTQIEVYAKKKSKEEITNKAPIEFSCPYCGYVYHSTPKFCVNCNRSID